MLKHKTKIMLGLIAMLHGTAHAGGGTSQVCLTLTQSSVTIQKVTKAGVLPYDATGAYMMEISGTTSAGKPIAVRFKVPKSPGSSVEEQARVESERICEDRTNIAIALGKPLQFVESGDGALCDISPPTSNLKLIEIRQNNNPTILLPPSTCAVGSAPGVIEIGIPDGTGTL